MVRYGQALLLENEMIKISTKICVLSLILFLNFAPTSRAENAPIVDVSGDISSDTVWSPNSGVYVLQGSVVLQSGVTLTIKPGTIIKGKNGGSGRLNIFGSLVATGTEALPIYFTSFLDDSVGGDTDESGETFGNEKDWRGIYFESGSSGVLDHVVVRYSGYGGGGFGDFVGIKNDGGNLIIKNSVISYNNQHGIWHKNGALTIENSLLSNQLYGLTVWGGTVASVSNNFTSNSQYGLYATAGNSLSLINNTFANNAKTAYLNASVEFTHTGNTSSDVTNKGFEISGDISGETAWNTEDLPIIIPNNNSVSVPAGSVLTINPGSIIKSGGYIIVDGALIANGTEGSKIYLTSIKNDSVGGDTNGDESSTTPNAADWKGIIFNNGSRGEISYTHIDYSGSVIGSTASTIFNFGGDLSLRFVEFANNLLGDVYQNAGSLYAYRSSFHNITNGITFESDGGTGTISQSSFATSGILNNAINNNSGAIIDARHNWWGNTLGPRIQGGPDISSSAIYGQVLYDPWLNASPITSPPKNPVIIIPGVMGSVLNNEEGEKWPNSVPMGLSYDDSYLDDLILDINGIDISSIFASDVIKGIGNQDFFLGLIDLLKSVGYQEDSSLFLFPYDWRLDINSSVSRLKDKIEEVKVQTGSEQVDLVAHSMGGLVVKKYLKDYGNVSVDRFADLATPHIGAPKTFKVLSYGDNFGFEKFGFNILNPVRTKEISQNMPSIYQLLPSSAYFDGANPLYKYYVHDGITSQNMTFDQTSEYLKTQGRNSLLVDRANTFHQEIDGLDPADYGVKTYNFVGCGTPTLGQIYIWGDDDYAIRLIDGDGTVPLQSALALPATKTYYVKNAKHALMPSASGVKDLITEILSGDDPDPSPYSNVAISASNCGVPNGNIVSFHSPIELHVYDEFGNHAGPDANGDIENNIEGVVYEVIGESKFVFLPDGITYTVRGSSIGSGTFGVRIEKIVDGEVLNTTIFSNIPLTSSTKVSFNLNGSTPTQVAIDSDGDGIFESSQESPFVVSGFFESSAPEQISSVVASSIVVTASSGSSAPPTTNRVSTENVNTANSPIVPINIPLLSVPVSNPPKQLSVSKTIDEEVNIEESIITNTNPVVLQEDAITDDVNLATIYKSFDRAMIDFFKNLFRTVWLWIVGLL